MSGVKSIYSVNAVAQFAEITEAPLYYAVIHEFEFAVHMLRNAVWIVVTGRDKGKIIFRTAYAPDGLQLTHSEKKDGGIRLTLTADIGVFTIAVLFPEEGKPLLHYVVTFKAAQDCQVPYWPKDIVILPAEGMKEPEGEVYASQIGTRTGLVYAGVKAPAAGSFLYLQDLSSLSDYCELTKTSAGGTVSGEWPEFGFALPQTMAEKPLPGGRALVISDAWVSFSKYLPADQFDIAKQFLSHIGLIYLYLPKPAPEYQNYPDILSHTLHDIETCGKCWTVHDGYSYLNAYVGDFETPPEIMVQLAVLLPVLDYVRWSGEKVKFAELLRNNLVTFWNPELKTIVRWLPALQNKLDGSEDQKNPRVMDSWYLYHPLLNLSRMALDGDQEAATLFVESLEYAMKVARHFNYRWPVFYNMQTLEVIRGETAPGQGGEKDVAGIYAHVMLQAWELTKEQQYLDEARTAAATLRDMGFDMFYQANNTAFSAGAMLRLFKETRDDLYLNLAYLCIANLFKNVALWECKYGFGRHFPSFFALFPLNDGPYTAVYEEHEGFAAIHDFLKHAEGLELLPCIPLLLAEFIKYAVSRSVYYYPPMLPAEMISTETKTGHVDRKLWIALEDIHDGWEESGEVGQEVYGAGLAFGVLPRHCIRLKGQTFMIFIDYPVSGQRQEGNSLSFRVLGHQLLTCNMHVINTGNDSPPALKVSAGDKNIAADNDGKYVLNGDQQVMITW
ncbi:hypothetical protein [Chitinophaga pinensis]|uniref:Uncharacterized protein n=1 Tax=Chitinophaga pinensis (strain ATCC 43595 / DSM 2588 / LMG 13176 / NBRC 15968 / NCIMB 11800 / UQM 2034) TaxID=485918 RepID=A0A979GUA3_CHIPD|nr:hypothetical protein [Chitinophaga pinensis]ACU62643.1 hypothetical protein Cpin_5212 [Chitinophaga pinensis DSM 2588]